EFYICRGSGSPELVGKGYFATETMVGVAFPDTMIAAQPNRELITREYLEVIWNSPFVRGQVISSARTTNGTYKINHTAAENISVPVPPMYMQKEFSLIASKISAIKLKHQIALRSDQALFASLAQRAFRGEL